MKKFFIRLIAVFAFLISSVHAVTFDVLVLPADLFNSKENYYFFEEVSEIIANDIIYSFNSSNGRIKSPELSEIKQQLNENPELKKLTQTALEKYKNTNKIDYETLKKTGNYFSCKSVLLINSYASANKNSPKRGVWEVMEITSAFDILYPYRLETSIVLIDTVNDLVMWSNNYSSKLGNNMNRFSAKNYVQANEELEKIKLYSKKIVAPGASQNITLRFFPKSIRPVKQDIKETNGNVLRFEKTIPEKPRSKDTGKDEFYGDMIYEF